MRTLFNIGDDLRALADLMDECEELSPEVDAAITAWFNELSADEAAKLDGYVGLIRTWEMEAAAAYAEAEQYEAKARVRANRAARLKDRLKWYLESTGRKKVETATKRTIAIQANGGPVPVMLADSIDPSTIPDDLAIVRRTIDTEAVRQFLLAGGTLDFAALGFRGTHLRIR